MSAALPMLFGQAVAAPLAYWIKVIIIVIAVVAIAVVAAKASGVNIPQWVVQIGWIVVAAMVAILAINFLLSIF